MVVVVALRNHVGEGGGSMNGEGEKGEETRGKHCGSWVSVLSLRRRYGDGSGG